VGSAIRHGKAIRSELPALTFRPGAMERGLWQLSVMPRDAPRPPHWVICRIECHRIPIQTGSRAPTLPVHVDGDGDRGQKQHCGQRHANERRQDKARVNATCAVRGARAVRRGGDGIAEKDQGSHKPSWPDQRSQNLIAHRPDLRGPQKHQGGKPADAKNEGRFDLMESKMEKQVSGLRDHVDGSFERLESHVMDVVEHVRAAMPMWSQVVVVALVGLLGAAVTWAALGGHPWSWSRPSTTRP